MATLPQILTGQPRKERRFEEIRDQLVGILLGGYDAQGRVRDVRYVIKQDTYSIDNLLADKIILFAQEKIKEEEKRYAQAKKTNPNEKFNYSVAFEALDELQRKGRSQIPPGEPKLKDLLIETFDKYPKTHFLKRLLSHEEIFAPAYLDGKVIAEIQQDYRQGKMPTDKARRFIKKINRLRGVGASFNLRTFLIGSKDDNYNRGTPGQFLVLDKTDFENETPFTTKDGKTARIKLKADEAFLTPYGTIDERAFAPTTKGYNPYAERRAAAAREAYEKAVHGNLTFTRILNKVQGGIEETFQVQQSTPGRHQQKAMLEHPEESDTGIRYLLQNSGDWQQRRANVAGELAKQIAAGWGNYINDEFKKRPLGGFLSAKDVRRYFLSDDELNRCRYQVRDEYGRLTQNTEIDYFKVFAIAYWRQNFEGLRERYAAKFKVSNPDIFSDQFAENVGELLTDTYFIGMGFREAPAGVRKTAGGYKEIGVDMPLETEPYKDSGVRPDRNVARGMFMDTLAEVAKSAFGEEKNGFLHDVVNTKVTVPQAQLGPNGKPRVRLEMPDGRVVYWDEDDYLFAGPRMQAVLEGLALNAEIRRALGEGLVIPIYTKVWQQTGKWLVETAPVAKEINSFVSWAKKKKDESQFKITMDQVKLDPNVVKEAVTNLTKVTLLAPLYQWDPITKRAAPRWAYMFRRFSNAFFDKFAGESDAVPGWIDKWVASWGLKKFKAVYEESGPDKGKFKGFKDGGTWDPRIFKRIWSKKRQEKRMGYIEIALNIAAGLVMDGLIDGIANTTKIGARVSYAYRQFMNSKYLPQNWGKALMASLPAQSLARLHYKTISPNLLIQKVPFTAEYYTPVQKILNGVMEIASEGQVSGDTILLSGKQWNDINFILQDLESVPEEIVAYDTRSIFEPIHAIKMQIAQIIDGAYMKGDVRVIPGESLGKLESLFAELTDTQARINRGESVVLTKDAYESFENALAKFVQKNPQTGEYEVINKNFKLFGGPTHRANIMIRGEEIHIYFERLNTWRGQLSRVLNRSFLENAWGYTKSVFKISSTLLKSVGQAVPAAVVGGVVFNSPVAFVALGGISLFSHGAMNIASLVANDPFIENKFEFLGSSSFKTLDKLVNGKYVDGAAVFQRELIQMPKFFGIEKSIYTAVTDANGKVISYTLKDTGLANIVKNGQVAIRGTLKGLNRAALAFSIGYVITGNYLGAAAIAGTVFAASIGYEYVANAVAHHFARYATEIAAAKGVLQGAGTLVMGGINMAVGLSVIKGYFDAAKEGRAREWWQENFGTPVTGFLTGANLFGAVVGFASVVQIASTLGTSLARSLAGYVFGKTGTLGISRILMHLNVSPYARIGGLIGMVVGTVIGTWLGGLVGAQVGGAIGGAIGGTIGVVLGAAFPVIGQIGGFILGSLAGSTIGAFIGSWLDKDVISKFFKNFQGVGQFAQMLGKALNLIAAFKMLFSGDVGDVAAGALAIAISGIVSLAAVEGMQTASASYVVSDGAGGDANLGGYVERLPSQIKNLKKEFVGFENDGKNIRYKIYVENTDPDGKPIIVKVIDNLKIDNPSNVTSTPTSTPSPDGLIANIVEETIAPGEEKTYEIVFTHHGKKFQGDGGAIEENDNEMLCNKVIVTGTVEGISSSDFEGRNTFCIDKEGQKVYAGEAVADAAIRISSELNRGWWSLYNLHPAHPEHFDSVNYPTTLCGEDANGIRQRPDFTGETCFWGGKTCACTKGFYKCPDGFLVPRTNNSMFWCNLLPYYAFTEAGIPFVPDGVTGQRRYVRSKGEYNGVYLDVDKGSNDCLKQSDLNNLKGTVPKVSDIQVGDIIFFSKDYFNTKGCYDLDAHVAIVTEVNTSTIVTYHANTSQQRIVYTVLPDGSIDTNSSHIVNGVGRILP